jgi:hypothetical protein
MYKCVCGHKYRNMKEIGFFRYPVAILLCPCSVLIIVSLPLQRRFPFIYIIHWSCPLHLSLRSLLKQLSGPFAVCNCFEHIHIILTVHFVLFKIDICFRPFLSNYVTSNLLSLLDIRQYLFINWSVYTTTFTIKQIKHYCANICFLYSCVVIP